MHAPKLVKSTSASISFSQTGGPCDEFAKETRVQNAVFRLDRRYLIEDVIGSGAYGVVVSARDTTTGNRVAIKKIEKAFDHPIYTKRTLRELKIMRLLDHTNILGIS
jgi:mitogen-activated protein kinase 1/3/mitogen-activated protein kinase 6